jgi:cellulose synthase/poly-beta-1,6-N-acetylglucosamine synthase-like glycosyltransferase
LEKGGLAQLTSQRTVLSMKRKPLRHSRIRYLAFCIPLILAYASWTYFPLLARWIVTNVFSYAVQNQQGSWLWNTTIQFFFTWYTFLAIGVAGVFAIAGFFARLEPDKAKRLHYPMVSLIVPAYNEEKNVSRCITSLFKCAEKYEGLCEIIVVDDGSRDYTYEIAWSTIEFNRKRTPNVRAKVVRHSSNLGKVEAIRTGVNSVLGGLVAIVDADSWWMPNTLVKLVDHMLSNGKKAVTGYVHPSDGVSELDSYVVLQQLEYSEGLGITRHAQSLSNNVLVVSGAIGLYDAGVLRGILDEKNIQSVTEDLEITLEMHKRGAKVGYVSVATSSTVVPVSFNVLWNQRLRWFTGWLHNTLSIHKDLLLKKSWLTLFLWYCYIFEYGGAFIDLAALTAVPFLFWFAPDRIAFTLSLLVFLPYGLLIGIVNQTIALKYAYNQHNYRSLLFYTPFYPILRLINILARLTSTFKYLLGDRGNWHHVKK